MLNDIVWTPRALETQKLSAEKEKRGDPFVGRTTIFWRWHFSRRQGPWTLLKYSFLRHRNR